MVYKHHPMVKASFSIRRRDCLTFFLYTTSFSAKLYHYHLGRFIATGQFGWYTTVFAAK
jgi:hypothetical protein